jgi:1-acyl-sn-glycerol-3-phosphate acyltransferase
MTFLRSLLFGAAFAAWTIGLMLVTLPVYFFSPPWFPAWVIRTWSRVNLLLLRLITGTTLEVRGREHLPKERSILAVKHQSVWETVVFFALVDDLSMIMKRPVAMIPLFGLYTLKAGMIAIDRGGQAAALRSLAAASRRAVAKGRHVLIFPEGTRRIPGVEPAYQGGVALLYRTLAIPVVPVALNSGLYWPLRRFAHQPGTVVVEFLPPIAPGLESRAFLTGLEGAIEAASDRLLVEAAGREPRPRFPREALAKLAKSL